MACSLKADLLHYCYAGERTIEEILAEFKNRSIQADDNDIVELVLDCVRAGELLKINTLWNTTYRISVKGKDALERELVSRPYPIRF